MRDDEVGGEAFASMWRREVAELRQYCLRHLAGNSGNADEAVSRVAMRAVQHFHSEIRCPRAWLRRIARNVCNDLYRERDRFSLDSLDGAESEYVEAADFATPESQYLAREARRTLREALRSLPPALSCVVKLYHVQGLVFTDIAAATGMSESNVRRLIGEAYDLLRMKLHHAQRASRRSVLRHATFGVTLPDRVETIRRVRAVRADGREVVFDLFLTYVPEGGTDRAIVRLQRYIADHPGGWRKRLAYARLLSERGDLAGARRAYEVVVERRALHVAAWLELAEIIRIDDGNEAAMRCHERAAGAVRPDAAPLFRALAGDWSQLGALPRTGFTAFVAARIAFLRGDVETSASILEGELESDPRNVALLAMSFDAWTLAGCHDRAAERLRLALEIEPENEALRARKN